MITFRLTLAIETLTPRFQLDKMNSMRMHHFRNLELSLYTRQQFVLYASKFTCHWLLSNEDIHKPLKAMLEWKCRGLGLPANIFPTCHNNFSE